MCEKKSAASWRAHSLRGKNMWQGGATLTCGVAGPGSSELLCKVCDIFVQLNLATESP